MKSSIVFLIPLFGNVPQYLKIFLKSAEFNSDYEFIFFSDLDLMCELPLNVHNYYLSLNDFKELLYKKTGIQTNFESYYKIVDFKPAYGLIFQDYIRDYKYWGILDIDLILGDINKFINQELLKKYDIISARKYWLSGSFALFKNVEKVNHLFENSTDWVEVFSSDKLYRFSETGTIRDSYKTLLNELRNGKSIFDIDAQIISFTHILKNQGSLDGIRVYFNDLIKESISRNMVIGYKNGRVFIHEPGHSDYLYNTDFLHYHFVSEKSRVVFGYPSWAKIPNEFYITEYGFLTKDDLEKVFMIRILRVIKSYSVFLFTKLPRKIFNKLKSF